MVNLVLVNKVKIVVFKKNVATFQILVPLFLKEHLVTLTHSIAIKGRFGRFCQFRLEFRPEEEKILQYSKRLRYKLNKTYDKCTENEQIKISAQS